MPDVNPPRIASWLVSLRWRVVSLLVWMFCVLSSFPTSASVASEQAALTTVQEELDRILRLHETQSTRAVRELIEMHNQFKTSANINIRREVLGELVYVLIDDDQRELARTYNAELAQLLQPDQSSAGPALAMAYQAALLAGDGNLVLAKSTIDRALKFEKQVRQKAFSWRVNNIAAMIYDESGYFNDALKYQFTALSMLDQDNLHDVIARLSGLYRLGIIYLDLRNQNLAIDYLDEGIALARHADAQNKLSRLMNRRGVALSDSERHAEAIVAYKEALLLSQKVADLKGQIIGHVDLSDAYFRVGEFDHCLQETRQAFDIIQFAGSVRDRILATINTGLCHMASGEVEVGAKEIRGGITELDKLGAKADIEPALSDLAALYEKAGLFKEAYQALYEHNAVSNELSRKDQERANAQMKANFDLQEQEKEIELLKQKNELQQADLKNTYLQRLILLIIFSVVGVATYLYVKAKEQSRALAVQDNLNKSKFLAEASHDLRQPMQAIGNLLEAATHAIGNGDVDKGLQLIKLSQSATSVMRRSFNSVLEISRLESGLIGPLRTTFNLHDLITESLESHRPVYEDADVLVEFKPSGVKMPIVSSDRILLGRVIYNLLSNAIKYSDPDKASQKKVLVGTVSLSGYLLIDIVDNGFGIAESEHRQIFEPFFQISNQGRDLEKGLGLGLSIVRGILKLMVDHRLTLRSIPGSGTRVSIYVPKGDAGQVIEPGKNIELSENELDGVYALVVEDNAMVRSSTLALLREHGILCEEYDSYESVLSSLPELERTPDILITDYGLPNGRSANDVASAVKQHCRNPVPTIIVTGEAGPVTLSQDLAHVKILRKPISPVDLLTEITFAVKRNG